MARGKKPDAWSEAPNDPAPPGAARGAVPATPEPADAPAEPEPAPQAASASKPPAPRRGHSRCRLLVPVMHQGKHLEQGSEQELPDDIVLGRPELFEPL